MIKRLKGESAARTGGILMMKILNKCSPSILVYNLFIDIQSNISIHCNISIHWYIGCLYEIEIQIFKKKAQLSDWSKTEVRNQWGLSVECRSSDTKWVTMDIYFRFATYSIPLFQRPILSQYQTTWPILFWKDIRWTLLGDFNIDHTFLFH